MNVIKFTNHAYKELSELSYEDLMDTLFWQYENDWPLRKDEPARYEALLNVAKKKAKTNFLIEFIRTVEGK